MRGLVCGLGVRSSAMHALRVMRFSRSVKTLRVVSAVKSLRLVTTSSPVL
jgi:hypothetical protein